MTLTDTPSPGHHADWSRRLLHDLAGNVLPWWCASIFDDQGRVLGGRDLAGAVLEVPRSAVLGTRLLWTFGSALARLPAGPATEALRPALAGAAGRAATWVQQALTDAEHGGLYWAVDAAGRPLADHKQSYAQAFGIYAWCARHAAGGEAQPGTALAAAQALFERLDAAAHDDADGGYFEGCTRDWGWLPGARLSAQEPPVPKTMNTTLHVLEALTELHRHAPAPRLRSRVAARLAELVGLFLDRLWLPAQGGFGLFFSRDWQNQTPQLSWGHDIEAAWLLVRAAEGLGDATLLQRCRALAPRIADAVLARGVAADGSVLGAGLFDGTVTDTRRHWWCQAEAMLGFWDAWQIGGDPRHAAAARRCWAFIEARHVDAAGGDWFKTLDADGRPVAAVPKAGPWECPYHHVRAELEMLERLALPGAASAP